MWGETAFRFRARSSIPQRSLPGQAPISQLAAPLLAAVHIIGMTMLDHLRGLTEHTLASDAMLAEALRAASPPADAVREYAHIIGSEEVWLARLEGRTARAAVWPPAVLDEVIRLRALVVEDYRAYVARLADDDLERQISYRNSIGLTFSNSIIDILLHVMLHGQYHRGKVNLLLRQNGLVPAPTDYIAFVRGVPAATLPDATRVASPPGSEG